MDQNFRKAVATVRPANTYSSNTEALVGRIIFFLIYIPTTSPPLPHPTSHAKINHVIPRSTCSLILSYKTGISHRVPPPGGHSPINDKIASTPIDSSLIFYCYVPINSHLRVWDLVPEKISQGNVWLLVRLLWPSVRQLRHGFFKEGIAKGRDLRDQKTI